MTMPPTAEVTNDTEASPNDTSPAMVAPTAKRYSTSEEASLSRLSPSSTTTRRFGRRQFLSPDAAATASGGATMAPSVTAAAQGRSGTSSLAVTATITVVNSTAPTASSRM